MFAKLFTIYPTPKDEMEARVCVYIDETADIPALAISHALKRLVRQQRQFAPNVAEVRRECARYLREQRRIAEGLDPHGGLDATGGEIDDALAERVIARAKEPVLALPAGKVVELAAPPSERDRATAILQREIDRLEAKMRARKFGA